MIRGHVWEHVIVLFGYADMLTVQIVHHKPLSVERSWKFSMKHAIPIMKHIVKSDFRQFSTSTWKFSHLNTLILKLICSIWTVPRTA
jgi:hypothetical protein